MTRIRLLFATRIRCPGCGTWGARKSGGNKQGGTARRCVCGKCGRKFAIIAIAEEIIDQTGNATIRLMK